MPLDFDYSQDHEFTKLLARSCDVDVTVAALELARDAQPDLSFAGVLNWIDARADELRPSLVHLRSDREMLELIGHVLSREHGINGDAEAFSDPDGSFLNRVIEKQRGIPISLSVLYVGVCQRLGIELCGVAAPMHFVTRLDGLEETLFVDAFNSGRVMTEVETVEWLKGITQLEAFEIRRSLGPVEPRLIIMRMLTNLKVLYANQENWSQLLRVQNRLLALNPAEYAERRDLALISLRADRPGTAARLLKSLLSDCPENERRLLESQLEQAERQVPRWN